MTVLRVPDGLSPFRASEEGRAWLDALPGLFEGAVRRWSLRPGDPFPYAYASLAVPAALPDGTEAVLKLAFPHREGEHEADALRRWAGSGAVRLLDDDPATGALLLERCRPGRPLAESADDALDVITGLLSRTWVPAGQPFRTLAAETEWWAGYLERRWAETGRAFPRLLLEAALEALRFLPGTQGPLVLVNQDLHAGNVLSAEREPWLVIDPKPLVGEREFGVAPVVRDRALGAGRRDVLGRLERLCSELALDGTRARAWALAQTVAWCFESGSVLPGHVEVATWLAE